MEIQMYLNENSMIEIMMSKMKYGTIFGCL